MEIRKLSLEEKRDIARNEIMKVSLELFLQKGYEKTTTRDIITQAGILNGSLYNRFKNKGEILVSIVKRATEDILTGSMDILKKENDFLEAAIFPGAVQLYISSISTNIASLIYEVHCKQDTVREFSNVFKDWFREFLIEYGYQLPDEHDVEMVFAALIGSVGAMVGCYAHGSKYPCKDAIKIYTLQVAGIIHMPVINIEGVVEKTMTFFETHDLTFMGLNISNPCRMTCRERTL